MATEGLLLLTNDGNLTHAVTHPSKGVEKEYLVQVTEPLSRARSEHFGTEWNLTME